MPLPTRHLGPLEVSALGLGCMGMSGAYGRTDAAQSLATLDAALERGVTLLDTAEMYGAGANERLLGDALRGRRDKVVLATKTGIPVLPVIGLPMGVDGRPATIRRAVDGSLRRLQTDYIDLYYLHRVDPRVPVEDSIGAMAEAVTAGKVRHLGISEATADEVRRAHATHPLAAAQYEWSLFSRDQEAEVVPTLRELGIGITAYSPLGRGMLTGSPKATTQLPLLDFRRLLPRWRKANLQHNLAQVETVRAVAAEAGITPARVALAWLLGQGDDVVPIPGSSKVGHLADNLAALAVTLTDEQRRRLDEITPSGDRYGSGTGVPQRR